MLKQRGLCTPPSPPATASAAGQSRSMAWPSHAATTSTDLAGCWRVAPAASRMRDALRRISAPNTTPSSASASTRHSSHELARRARPQTRRHHAQDLRRWQSHEPRRADPTGPRLRAAYRKAAGPRPHRPRHHAPTGTDADRPRRLSVRSSTLTAKQRSSVQLLQFGSRQLAERPDDNPI